MSQTFEDNVNYSLLGIVNERFFSHQNLKANPNVEGMVVVKGSIILGCKAGPDKTVNNLFHEMGHLIMCPDNRVGLPSWGLHYKNVVEINNYSPFAEPTTCQDVMLELNVIGWQAVLENELTESINGALNHVESLRFLVGWSNYKREVRDLPYSDRDKARTIHGQNFVKDFVSKHSLRDFEKEWARKSTLITHNTCTIA